SNTGASDLFGSAIALSDNGKMLVVGAYNEDNGAKGIITNGSEVIDLGTATNSGAVYVFIKDSSGSWAQSAYIKASNTGADDNFGASLVVSEDGNTLTVGAWFEDNSVTGVVVDGSEITDLSTINNAGAVYVFTKDNAGVWSQSAYIKGSNTGSGDSFGVSLSVSDNDKTLAIGATGESNSAKGIIINGSEINDVGSAASAGAVYLFTKDSSGNWSQIAYLKASNTGMVDYFGKSLALSDDGNLIAVGAYREDNKATGVIIDGSETIDAGTENDSGAVYLY
ncbi:hypothetical protein LPR20_003436, partial [Vibrio mimicus]